MRYTGKDVDPDTGLYYFNARWYDAQTGRFISEDPVLDGTLWFAYVSNNPMTFVDPTGLDSTDFYEAMTKASATEQAALSSSYDEIVQETDPGNVNEIIQETLESASSTSSGTSSSSGSPTAKRDDGKTGGGTSGSALGDRPSTDPSSELAERMRLLDQRIREWLARSGVGAALNFDWGRDQLVASSAWWNQGNGGMALAAYVTAMGEAVLDTTVVVAMLFPDLFDDGSPNSIRALLSGAHMGAQGGRANVQRQVTVLGSRPTRSSTRDSGGSTC